MARMSEWSGDVWAEEFVVDKELDKLISFINTHEKIFIYGNGKVGKGMEEFFRQCEIVFDGFVTSESINELQKKYHAGNMGIVIGVGDAVYKEIETNLKDFNENDIFLLSREKRDMLGVMFSNEIARKCFHLIAYVVNDCNLNCKSCSTFAPICKPDYYDLNTFEKDIVQITSLNFDSIKVFKFTGGEPFRHPQLIELFATARKYLPETPMECYTNGILLQNYPEEQLKKIAELRITLVITEYPIAGLNLQSIYKRLDELEIDYYVIYSSENKVFFKRPLNMNKNTAKHMFYYCPRYRKCSSLILNNGKLYKCMYQLVTKYFDKYFNTKFELREKDYIDIYHAEKEQIYRYITTRVPFCDYCSPVTELVSWEQSKREIEEWT